MEFTLRKWRPEDATPKLVGYANNYNVSRFLTDGFPHPYTIDDAKAYVELVAGDEPVKVFAIDVDGSVIGSIGIFPQSDIHRINGEIGYWLAEEFWG